MSDQITHGSKDMQDAIKAVRQMTGAKQPAKENTQGELSRKEKDVQVWKRIEINDPE